MDFIRIRGARTHNLRSIDVDIPRNQLTVITGLSGSGKSSLAFDTIYAEGQRRYVESLSTYARQFLQLMEKPDVDLIEGLSPAIAIEQKATNHNPRSTVGTVTEIHDYLRLLYARAGTPHCPEHPEQALEAQSVAQMVDRVLALPEGTRILILAPLKFAPSELSGELQRLRAQGFVRIRLDGTLYELDALPPSLPAQVKALEIVVDRLKVRADLRGRLAESFETALHHGLGRASVANLDDASTLSFCAYFACPICDYQLTELEPRLFSFNNPAGACPRCDGLGEVSVFAAERVVTAPDKSLADGAIACWSPDNALYRDMLACLASHYGFELTTPFAALPDTIQHILLHGSGQELIEFRYPADRGRTVQKKHPFEGILPNLERRYRTTDSQTLREELAQLRVTHICPACSGARLRREARHVLLAGHALPALNELPLEQLQQHFDTLQLTGNKALIGDKILTEIRARLRFLNDVGLSYLALARKADSLSGGEAQRIRLASQIGSGLTGVTYVLDEPSIGLHQRDNDRLLATLRRLRDLGNTVIVVEHDEDAIQSADFVVDMGPGAGTHGGQIIANGPPTAILTHPDSLTGAYLSGRKQIRSGNKHRISQNQSWLEVRGCSGNNLRNVTLQIPCGLFTCVTGVSGSGKSTLINDTLYAIAARHFYRNAVEPAPYESVAGLELFDKVVNVDQSPIGRTPRSNPATYTGLFTAVRELFAGLPESKARGYGAGRFSFNVKGGRCEACQGDGLVKIEMNFLPDMYVPCDICHGTRYNRETLEVRYKGLNIHEVLELTVNQAAELFAAIPALQRKLSTLQSVGLGYIKLGQSATTLSGGEAQRVKLALELAKRDTGKTLYILDEPTTGLHFADVDLLLGVLLRLRDHGNTIIVIEHNLDMIQTADWIIDLGPEGGAQGGQIVATGTPEEICHDPNSLTGRYLAKHITNSGPAERLAAK
jgi:excinuclease ABC subunit A